MSMIRRYFTRTSKNDRDCILKWYTLKNKRRICINDYIKWFIPDKLITEFKELNNHLIESINNAKRKDRKELMNRLDENIGDFGNYLKSKSNVEARRNDFKRLLKKEQESNMIEEENQRKRELQEQESMMIEESNQRKKENRESLLENLNKKDTIDRYYENHGKFKEELDATLTDELIKQLDNEIVYISNELSDNELFSSNKSLAKILRRMVISQDESIINMLKESKGC